MTISVFAPLPLACLKLVRANGNRCPGEKEYCSLSRDEKHPRKNRPTEAWTAGERDCFSIAYGVWIFLHPPSGDPCDI